MLLQILNNPRPFGPLEIISLAVACVVIGVVVCYMLMHERANLTAQPGAGELTPAPASKFKWRKAAPYLLFFGFILVFIALRYAATNVPEMVGELPVASPVLPDPSVGVLPDVDGATQAAKQQASGYVQPSGLVSKLLTMVIIFSLFSFLLWKFQQITHPGIADWKEKDYTREFKELPSIEKFKESREISLGWKILAAATIVGACLIQ